jgi:hypothetical protein
VAPLTSMAHWLVLYTLKPTTVPPAHVNVIVH